MSETLPKAQSEPTGKAAVRQLTYSDLPAVLSIESTAGRSL